MRDSSQKHDFVLELEENAFDSLIHGFKHFDEEEMDTDLKYTVLHVFHAAELFLKARLAKAHPLLIYQKPEDPPEKAHTVDFQTAIKRLHNLGVALPSLDGLTQLRRLRNAIEHHRVVGNRQEIGAYVGLALRFLEGFVERELNISLKERLGAGVYEAMMSLLYTYQERVEKAKQSIEELLPKGQERLDYQTLICEECGEGTVIFPDPTTEPEKVHCFFCNAQFFTKICERCDKVSLSSRHLEDDDLICQDCWDDLMAE